MQVADLRPLGIFDGLAEHDYNTSRISTRHSKNTKCNVLFADGHAETIVWRDTWQSRGGTPTEPLNMWRQAYAASFWTTWTYPPKKFFPNLYP